MYMRLYCLQQLDTSSAAVSGVHVHPNQCMSLFCMLPLSSCHNQQLEDFDDGVVHQLNAKRSEDEAVAAVRHIAHYELGTIQHMAAYLNHLVKHYNHNAAAAAAAAAAADTTVGLSNALAAAAAAAVAANTAAAVHGSGATAATMQQLLGAGMLGGNGTLGSTVGAGRGAAGGGGAVGGAAGLGAYGGQIRLASVPVSTKAMLQKLPLKVFKQIELLVQNCAYLEWRHFDAGVIKVGVAWHVGLTGGCLAWP
jgi:hypothetical protein